MNASIYVWKRDALMNTETIYLENTRIYLMPKWAIDIDDETDFEFVEYMLSRRIK
jgi:CMP-N,N'-diacetyllegionaminic acid synthase